MLLFVKNHRILKFGGQNSIFVVVFVTRAAVFTVSRAACGIGASNTGFAALFTDNNVSDGTADNKKYYSQNQKIVSCHNSYLTPKRLPFRLLPMLLMQTPFLGVFDF